MVDIIVARKLSEMAVAYAKKGEKCRNSEQIQSKSTKMRAMRC